MTAIAATVARHWPFANGSGRIIDRFARDIDLGTGRRVARTSDGFEMSVLADDLIGRHLLLSGKFDRSIVQVLLDRARLGDTLLDIGSNIGYVAACFLQNVQGSQAICVEPQPGIVDLLKENLGQFGSRAEVHQVALSDQSGELSFEINNSNRGASRLSPTGTLKVPAIHASQLLAGKDRVDIIKIDVEGHEQSVFKAMADDLERLRPRCILFEDHTTEAGPEGYIGSLLDRLDYDMFGVSKTLLKTRLVPVRSASECRYNDYLAVAR